ncbi:hypothetical protein SSP24_00660 [Streptomyces spinoverrucosus]|uniref:DUF7144 domain-containing protein n=1 Tax=Streptomyces spinoverrucosus TaxID=284043 RepID=A0A4Y3VA73_9ACTN|nr:hypothetical protein [Streptomyces spinoverrucosus]GEC02411.1 hypothetical protein SSP24_00660 [Streptomyces spinoverrucosus]GHB43144.1 hypothetical protein GCM10010397_11930 [Streptomyces spinoverrucosus]
MAETPGGVRQRTTEPRSSDRVTGPSLFAGWALELSGSLSILLGITGIARDTIFSAPRYTYRFDLTTWGWLHLVIGIALVAAGLGVLLGKSWGTGAGVALGAVSLVTQFMFIPYYPLWSISVMTLDLLAIWTLSRFSAPYDT